MLSVGPSLLAGVPPAEGCEEQSQRWLKFDLRTFSYFSTGVYMQELTFAKKNIDWQRRLGVWSLY